MTEPLYVWTIYNHPEDYPDGYVVRQWSVHGGPLAPVASPRAYGFPTLTAARLSLPPGLTRFPADPSDDPVVLESWV